MKQSAVKTFIDYMDTYNFWRQQSSFGGVFLDVEMNITNGTEFIFATGASMYECTVRWKNKSPNPFVKFSVPSFLDEGIP